MHLEKPHTGVFKHCGLLLQEKKVLRMKISANVHLVCAPTSVSERSPTKHFCGNHTQCIDSPGYGRGKVVALQNIVSCVFAELDTRG